MHQQLWSPYQQCDIYQIEKIQRSAARWVTNDYSRYSSVSVMLNDLCWSSLEHRRNYLKLVMFFKINHGQAQVSPMPLTYQISNTRGHDYRYTLLPAKTDKFMNPYFPSTAKLWNNLPHHVVTSESLTDFKQKLSNYFCMLEHSYN